MKKVLITILFIIPLILVGCIGKKPIQLVINNNINVVAVKNPDDKSKSDIYLRDSSSGQEIFYITIKDLYRGHYHNLEYHNGNLYVIRRTGGDEGYLTNPDWTDELWRYNKKGTGQKIYSARGLDFRVSDNEKLIAIFTNEEFDLLDANGNVIKTFKSDETLATPSLSAYAPASSFLAWSPDSIWLMNSLGPALVGIVNVNTSNFAIKKFDLSDLGVSKEYAFNVKNKELAFSNYPAFFDVDSVRKYEQSGARVDLMVYNLESKSIKKVAFSVAKNFEPKWIDDKTLEYNNPNGLGRLTKEIF